MTVGVTSPLVDPCTIGTLALDSGIACWPALWCTTANLIDVAVAVVVFTVADLWVTNISQSVTVVAVTSTDTLGVAIVVVLSGWHVAITVVVVTVTNLWSAWIGLIVEVVAVALADHPAVMVVIVLIKR